MSYIDLSAITNLINTLVPSIITLFVVMYLMKALSSVLERVTVAV